jgi:preprotein translocase subunit SecE
MNKNSKIMNLCFLVCAFVAWLLVSKALDAVFGILKINYGMEWVVSLPNVVGILAGIVLFIFMNRAQKIRLFADDVIVEMTKVTWPERKETVLSTGIIIIMVAIASLILLGFDFVWGTIVKFIF